MFSGLSTHTAVNVECSSYIKCQAWFSPLWQYEELNNNGNDILEESPASVDTFEKEMKDSSREKVSIGLKQKVTENCDKELEVMKGNVEYIRNLQKMLDQSKEEIERLDKENRKCFY